jgi:hypothetical protein
MYKDPNSTQLWKSGLFIEMYPALRGWTPFARLSIARCFPVPHSHKHRYSDSLPVHESGGVYSG